MSEELPQLYVVGEPPPLEPYSPEVVEPPDSGHDDEPRGGVELSMDTDKTSGSTHPFKIQVVDDGGLKLRVQYGNVSRMKMFTDSGGTDLMGLDEISVGIGLGQLVDDPAGGGPGEISLDDNEVYGVWIEFTTTRDQDFWLPASPEYVNLSDYEFLSGVIVASKDSPGNSPNDALLLAAAGSGKAYKWVGRVDTTDGVPTIQQYLKSDLMLPGFAVPYQLVSADLDNAMQTGTDNGLKVVVVSADAENSITPGSDLGAYYKDDDSTQRDVGDQTP